MTHYGGGSNYSKFGKSDHGVNTGMLYGSVTRSVEEFKIMSARKVGE